MPLPVSVVIPHQKRRAVWFHANCLPSVKTNDPAEIFIEDQEGGACEKRNAGAKKATQPFLLFVDDDTALKPGAIRAMLEGLERDPGAAFAYGDLIKVIHQGIPYPKAGGIMKSWPWSLERLRMGNYIDTASLIRREAFPGFDPMIRRFQDWDLWLTMAERGHRGIYLPVVLFESHYIDHGISMSVPLEEPLRVIRRKHGMDNTLSIIIPTVGRATLRKTLESLLPDLARSDQAIVVGDGPRPELREMLTSFKGGFSYTELGIQVPNRGASPRNLGVRAATRGYLWFVDDDGWVAPGTIPLIREVISKVPGRPLVFRFRNRGDELWKSQEISPDNLRAQMIVVPNLEERVPRWDLDGAAGFLARTAALHPDGEASIAWRPESVGSVLEKL